MKTWPQTTREPDTVATCKSVRQTEDFCMFLRQFTRRRQWHPSPVLLPGKSHGLYSLLGFSVHGISQGRILGWVAIFSSRASSQPRDQTHISLCLLHCKQIFYLVNHQRKICSISVLTFF